MFESFFLICYLCRITIDSVRVMIHSIHIKIMYQIKR